MSRLFRIYCLAVPLLMSTGLLYAAPVCKARSPAHTVALLELYTSEGCNSCPPADRFVSGLRGDGLDRDKVVPLSLHVDYWDYIGWKDVYASPVFTERQRWLSAQAGSRTLYTPEIFLGGAEQRHWKGGIAAAVQRINQQPARANIELAIGRMAGSAIPVEARVQAPRDSKLFVALVESGLSSQVSAGENRGVTLRHDHVVRDWIGPVSIDGEGKLVLPRPLSVAAVPVAAAGAGADGTNLSNLSNLSVAAFVQDEHGVVLQALSAGLCM